MMDVLKYLPILLVPFLASLGISYLEPFNAPMPIATPTPTMTPVPAAAAGGKGIGLTQGSCTLAPSCAELETLGVTWAHTWSPTTPDLPCVETVPMIWGEGTLRNGCPELGGTSEWLLGFNEPDFAGARSYLSPQDGAALWHVVEACYPDRKLVAPAIVKDLSWLTQMRDAYVSLYQTAPRFDALGLHCYPIDGRPVSERCRELVGVMAVWLDAWDIDGGIWVNEWSQPPGAAYGGLEQAKVEMARMLAFFDETPAVARHAWWTYRFRGNESWYFGADDENTSLFECDASELTELGIEYAK